MDHSSFAVHMPVLIEGNLSARKGAPRPPL